MGRCGADPRILRSPAVGLRLVSPVPPLSSSELAPPPPAALAPRPGLSFSLPLLALHQVPLPSQAHRGTTGLPAPAGRRALSGFTILFSAAASVFVFEYTVLLPILFFLTQVSCHFSVPSESYLPL